MQQAYKICQQHDSDSHSTASSAVCVEYAIFFILRSFGAAFGGPYITDAIESSFKEPQTSSPRLEIRRDEPQKALLDHFNKGSRAHDLRATTIVPSHIHPRDGLALRLNVHGDNSVMHLHTNGSHGMVVFDSETQLRDTSDFHFIFTGIDHFKAQVHSINHPVTDDWTSEIDHVVRRWTEFDAQPESILKRADSWRFEVCNLKKTATFFYGMLAVDEQGTDYVPNDPPGCH